MRPRKTRYRIVIYGTPDELTLEGVDQPRQLMAIPVPNGRPMDAVTGIRRYLR